MKYTLFKIKLLMLRLREFVSLKRKVKHLTFQSGELFLFSLDNTLYVLVTCSMHIRF